MTCSKKYTIENTFYEVYQPEFDSLYCTKNKHFTVAAHAKKRKKTWWVLGFKSYPKFSTISNIDFFGLSRFYGTFLFQTQ